MSARPEPKELFPAEDSRRPLHARPKVQVAQPRRSGADGVSSPRPARRWLTLPRLFAAATVVLLVWGYNFPTGQYLSPQSGAGYVLGIVGGSSMLVLLFYPLRKRFRALAFIGTTKRWFQAHMALGIIGPVLILFHANFSLGAVNSNVALACMLVVSGSGLFGRYFYAHIHHGLHGRKATLAELKEHAERLRWVTSSVEFLPALVARLEEEEQRILARSERTLLLARPPVAAAGVFFARLRLRWMVARSLRAAHRSCAMPRARREQLRASARQYIDDRLAATREVVEFAAYERLFSLWHALHLPLFVMLLIAGVAHVIAVHVY